jgi:hypothetical protein
MEIEDDVPKILTQPFRESQLRNLKKENCDHSTITGCGTTN